MSHDHSSDLLQRLKNGEHIIMDGALGTELERRGVPFEAEGWSALAVRDYGEVIRQVHRDFISAGAKLHIVNSFALAKHVLDPIGLGADFEQLNRRSVCLFDEAVAESGIHRQTMWAAGSISTFAAKSDRSLLPAGQALVENCREQAIILAEAGVDLFALEMLFDVDVSLRMYDGVKDLGLPVIMGFTCDWGEDNTVTTCQGVGIQPTPLSLVLPQIIDSLDTERVILSIMHSEADVTDSALDVLKQHWDGPVAIYPNSGHFVDLHLQFDSVCNTDSFEQAAKNWKSKGVQIVGGCCGITPEHIKAFSSVT